MSNLAEIRGVVVGPNGPIEVMQLPAGDVSVAMRYGSRGQARGSVVPGGVTVLRDIVLADDD